MNYAKSIIESILPVDNGGLSPYYFRQLLEHTRQGTKPLGSYNSGGFTSKMWILPNGTLESLGEQHSEWLKSHPDVMAKFGLDLSAVPNEDTPIRLAALSKGFIRLNFEQRSGLLTVEANVRYWTKGIKDTLFVLVADNSISIGAMSVNLLNTEGKVVRHGYSQLFTYSGREKLEHLPLISESRRGRALSVWSWNISGMTSIK